MSDTKKVTLKELKNTYKQGLLIPEIQREYVMGAGGKSSNGEDKLERLLDTILASCKEHIYFDFSCIITYCEDIERSKLEIYDGQQRLTTLLIMTIFKLYEENKSNEVYTYKDWYSFLGRTSTNNIIDRLTNRAASHHEITEDDVVDFSSFSMLNLWQTLKEGRYKAITSEYLLNEVKFDMVSIGSQSEIEQFFMDLNSGVKLKDYELYKAKLVHHISTFNSEYYNESIKEALQGWPHRMDNEWLDFFNMFADFHHPAEEYEVEFVKYCIRMTCLVEKIEYDENNFDCINEYIILKVYKLMELVSRLNFSYLAQEENIIENVLKFSWGDLEEKLRGIKKCNYDKRGAFWNLEYETYDKLLYHVIRGHLIKKEHKDDLYNDAVLWCFITTLDWNIDAQNEYLRLVKIILNHNTEKNSDAWYECQDKGQYLYYCKYNAHAIPQYYGKHINLKYKDDEKLSKDIECMKSRHLDMFILNKWLVDNFKMSKTLDREKIALALMDHIKDSPLIDIRSIIEKRMSLIQDYRYNGEYIAKENAVFGFSDKIKQPIIQGYYLEDVKLNWPTRSSNNMGLKCSVKVNCKSDLLFLDHCKGNHDTVARTVEVVSSNELGDDFIDKCFWTGPNKVHKLINRVTDSSKTYNKMYSDSDKGWRDTWRC